MRGIDKWEKERMKIAERKIDKEAASMREGSKESSKHGRKRSEQEGSKGTRKGRGRCAKPEERMEGRRKERKWKTEAGRERGRE